MPEPEPVNHRPSTLRGRRELYDAVVERLQARMGELDLQINDVAGDTFASRRQIQRVMEDRGTTFRAELARIRMERAALLLASTRVPVRDIALRVGYRQSAQFAKAFRARYGVAPTTYRGEHGTSRWTTAA